MRSGTKEDLEEPAGRRRKPQRATFLPDRWYWLELVIVFSVSIAMWSIGFIWLGRAVYGLYLALAK